MIYEIEVTRRVLREDAPVRVVASRQVYDYAMRNCYKPEDMWKESVWMLVLDKRNSVMAQYKLSDGGTDMVVIDKKVVAMNALKFLASAVILIHNHPSGSCLPSQSDINETAELSNALRTLDIHLLDHVVIGEGEYFSFESETTTKI